MCGNLNKTTTSYRYYTSKHWIGAYFAWQFFSYRMCVCIYYSYMYRVHYSLWICAYFHLISLRKQCNGSAAAAVVFVVVCITDHIWMHCYLCSFNKLVDMTTSNGSHSYRENRRDEQWTVSIQYHYANIQISTGKVKNRET